MKEEQSQVDSALKGIDRKKALAIYETKWWEGKSSRTIAEFQIQANNLCCPFNVFHKALQETLGRPVLTHEMALNWKGLMDELFNGSPSPSFQEILDLIPKEKRIVVVSE